jgi:CheY-like chemotaxis protein
MSIDVIDTGIGLKPEQLERLFQAFSQADSSMSRRYGGTGLGLAISQRLAGLLGGRITVTSALGAGSTFHVQIPIGPLAAEPWIEFQSSELADVARDAEVRQASPGVGALPDATLPLSGRRILLAEDGPDNQWLISHLLEKNGAQVELVEDGLQAVAKAHGAWQSGQPFDAVLMDMQMPVLDGYEATRRLRVEGYDLPILALTAHAMAGDRQKCLAAGCDDYLTKPIQLPQLLASLARSFSRREAVENVSSAMTASSSHK